MATKTQAKPVFAATLTPHRSLDERGKRIVIVLISLLALVPGVLFYAVGAWPVINSGAEYGRDASTCVGR